MCFPLEGQMKSPPKTQQQNSLSPALPHKALWAHNTVTALLQPEALNRGGGSNAYQLHTCTFLGGGVVTGDGQYWGQHPGPCSSQAHSATALHAQPICIHSKAYSDWLVVS